MIDNLIEDNKKLIYFIASRFKNYKSKEDLYQAGVLGLLKAKENYNSSYNVKFSTYAFSFILGEMNKLVKEDKGIKISRDISKLNNKIEKVYSLLSQKLMREPTYKEIADFLEVPEYFVCEAIISTNKIRSINEPLNDDGRELTFEDVIGKCDNIDDLIMLKDALNTLTCDERKLIISRYFDDYTQNKVATMLGLSQVQVSRSEQKILKKMNKQMTV